MKKLKEFKICNKCNKELSFNKFKDNICPVLKKPFEMGFKSGKTKSMAPSLDKIIPSKGYTKGNIVVISDIVNRLKSDASLEDLKKIINFYIKK